MGTCHPFPLTLWLTALEEICGVDLSAEHRRAQRPHGSRAEEFLDLPLPVHTRGPADDTFKLVYGTYSGKDGLAVYVSSRGSSLGMAGACLSKNVDLKLPLFVSADQELRPTAGKRATNRSRHAEES